MFATYLLVGVFGILVCFIANAVAIEAIVGGDIVEDHHVSFPYQASLMLVGQGLVCGGAIIDDEFIVTAAHCVLTEDGYLRSTFMSILVGSNNLHKTMKPALIIEVKQIYVPIAYDPKNFRGSSDIAVLKLDTSLELSKNHHLKKLELPHSENANYAHHKAMISGFGWDMYQRVDGQSYGLNGNGELRFAVADVLPPGESGIHLNARIEQRNWSEPRGVCHNDNGGPLVYNKTTLIGVLTVAVLGCSELTHGAWYTPVTHYLKFIERTMDYERNKYHWDMHMYQLKF